MITVIATALNVIKFVGHVELFTECEVGFLLIQTFGWRKKWNDKVKTFEMLASSIKNNADQNDSINHQEKDVCVGPLIKYTVFDAFFGALCGIILILGSLQKSLVKLL